MFKKLFISRVIQLKHHLSLSQSLFTLSLSHSTFCIELKLEKKSFFI